MVASIRYKNRQRNFRENLQQRSAVVILKYYIQEKKRIFFTANFSYLSNISLPFIIEHSILRQA